MALGGILFAVYGLLYPGSVPRADSKRIEPTVDDVSQVEIAFAAQWERAPSAQELTGLIEDHVREEVLYREALALGLDKDDTIVKRRMAQKMGFLAEDLAAARQPTTPNCSLVRREFRAVCPTSARHFPPTLIFPDKRGQHARDDAELALRKLQGQPENSAAAAALTDRFMFQDYYPDRTPDQLAKDFGPSLLKHFSSSNPVPGRDQLSPASASISFGSSRSLPSACLHLMM